MIWNLLMGICFFIAVRGAWDAATVARTSAGGHVLAVVIGLVVGVACAWAMWRVGETAGTRALKQQSESRQRWYIRGIYASSIFWIFLAAVLGKWAASELLRLIT
jgi:hypothetical protein